MTRVRILALLFMVLGKFVKLKFYYRLYITHALLIRLLIQINYNIILSLPTARLTGLVPMVRVAVVSVDFVFEGKGVSR